MGLEVPAYVGDLNAANPTTSDKRKFGDDHFRYLKTALKQTMALAAPTFTTAGTAPTLTITTSHANTPTLKQQLYAFVLHTDLAGDDTLNIDSLGAKNLQKLTAAGWTNVEAGDWLTGAALFAYYDTSAAKFRILSARHDAALVGKANTFTATQTVQSSDAGAGAGPDFTLHRASASPAASDAIGRLNFTGMDSGAAVQTYAQILAYINDPTAASEDGGLAFLTTTAGTTATRMLLDTSLEMSVPIDEVKGADIASAGTTDLSASTGNFVHITGTTTITALGTMQAGVERTLLFEDALTLTHNGTSLILPTGANITTAAGDTARFRSEGSGNWRCVAYMRASGAALVTTGITKFVSSDLAISAGATAVIAHGLGATPTFITVDLVCQSNDAGYTASQVVQVDWLSSDEGGGSPCGIHVQRDGTNLNYKMGTGTGTGNIFRLINFSTGAMASLTNASWKVRLTAYLVS